MKVIGSSSQELTNYVFSLIYQGWTRGWSISQINEFLSKTRGEKIIFLYEDWEDYLFCQSDEIKGFLDIIQGGIDFNEILTRIEDEAIREKEELELEQGE